MPVVVSASKAILVFLLAAAVVAAADVELRPLLEAGHLRRAQSIAQQRLTGNANDAEALYAVAAVKYKSGDLDGAIPFAEKASSLQPKEAEYHNLLAQLYGTQAQKASVLRQMGLARKCRKELDAALALDPRHYEANMTLMIYLLKAPGVLGGDKARARAIPDEILHYDAARGYMAKARLLREEGSKEDLTEWYRKAAESDSKNVRAQVSYANALLNAGKNFEEVEKRARLLVEQTPERFEGYLLLAARHALGDRWAEMDAVLRDAQKRSPDNLYPLYNTAVILQKRGKELQRAEAYLRAYLAREPELAMPNHSSAHRVLALVLEKQGRKAEAIAQLETALRLQPDFDDAKKDLKRLRG